MMRVLMALALLVAGVGAFLQTQGTFANMQDIEPSGATFEAEVVEDGSHDPWFAYEDVNNDNRYTEDLDIAIPDQDILDGHHVVSDPRHGLVIPKSVGTVQPDAGPIHLEAGARGHLVVEVRLASPSGITLIAGQQATLSDLVAEAQGTITIDAGDDLDVAGAYLRSSTGSVDLFAKKTLRGLDLTAEATTSLSLGTKQGAIQVHASSLTAGTTLDLDAGGEITAEQASLQAGGPLTLDARGDVRVKQATLETPDDIEILGGNVKDTLFVEGARFRDANDTAKAGPNGIEIVGTPAEGEITYQG